MKEQNGWGRPVLCQNVKPEHDQLSARIAKNQLTIDRSEGYGADYEQIDRSYCCGVITQKGFPALPSWSTNPEHISSSDRRFTDDDSEHQQLAKDPWRAPRWILPAHPPD
jgi:hypothetical protein